ncbi:glycosyltransferase family 4 protein [Candidatus Pelagibacter sp.]|uniref:glycosyltransferase family 4 protein n=1 Tax=Candidatus Pelagibacter sp. TaxID=2024849 RepID=UPI003F85ECB3
MKKKTLIFFLPNFSQGGAAQSITKLMIFLSKKKYRCILICLGKCFYYKELFRNKVIIIEINSNRTILSILKIREKIKKFLKKDQKTILISNINYANVLSIIFFRTLNNFKIILYERTPIQELNYDYGNIHKKLKNLITKFLIFIFYRYSDKVITNSKKSSSDLSFFIKRKVETIYSKSIDKIKPFQKKNIRGAKIIWIGRLSKEKSFDTLIEAISLLRKKNIIVSVMSGTSDVYKYKKKIKFLKLENYFNFFSYKKNLTKYFKFSNLFISTSLYESFPNAVIQAINHSLPVISSKSDGGISDIIINNHTGILFEKKNSKDLAKKILNFINNQKLHNIYAYRAHKNLKKFEFDKVETKFEKLLMNL